MSQKYRESMDKIFVSDELKTKIMKNAKEKLKKKKPKSSHSVMTFIRYASYAACLALCVTALSTSGRREALLPNPSSSAEPTASAKTPEPTEILNNSDLPDKKTPDNQTGNAGRNNAAMVQDKKNIADSEKTIPKNKEPDQNNNSENKAAVPKENEEMPPSGNETPPLNEDNEFVMAPPPASADMNISAAANQVGYKFKLPPYAPEGYSEGEISLLFGKLIQVRFECGEDTIFYRTEKCCEDISGDYNLYDNVKTELINNCSVTIKGTEDKYYVAVWSEGESSFSITSQKGLQKEELVKIIESVDFPDFENKKDS